MNNPSDAWINPNQCFVFAVCGAERHIRALHYSLKALRRHSRSDILVVTSALRNEIEIEWPRVIDIATPAHLDNQQAGIFIKTSLHRFVPPGPRYCYLDTDIVAVHPSVDEIFSYNPNPIRFAADHVGLSEFSPHAVRCGCQARNHHDIEEITEIKEAAYASLDVQDPEPKLCRTSTDYEERADKMIFRWAAFLRWAAGRPSPSQHCEPAQRRWQRYWLESQDRVLWEPPTIIDHVERTTSWRRDHRRQSWITPNGNDIYHLACDHLMAQIATTFGIVVKESNWQHWNGGVFLFDRNSAPFLEQWHENTLRIFNDPLWLTRDQGTLVATIWQLGLQNAPILPQAFNLVADPCNRGLMISKSGLHLTKDGFLSKEKPRLIHALSRVSALSRFLDPTWDVWQWVTARATGDEILRRDAEIKTNKT